MDTKDFWKSSFGSEYHERNDKQVINNYAMFNKIFCKYPDFMPRNIIEFGAGIGQNIIALKQVFPFSQYTALEINHDACGQLKRIDNVNVIEGAISYVGKYDLVVCKGILIHIHPDDIYNIYDIIYKSASKYILIAEYYNPDLIEVEYRGHAGKLWKRDFAGEMIKAYPDLNLIDYGFVSKYDEFKQDDINWFLLEKK